VTRGGWEEKNKDRKMQFSSNDEIRVPLNYCWGPENVARPSFLHYTKYNVLTKFCNQNVLKLCRVNARLEFC
jgi:hypothetical protein